MEPFLSKVSPPPRAINVQQFMEARASELQALYTVVSLRANNNFRSHRNKRRRTRSYDNRVTRKRRMNWKLDMAGEASISDPKRVERKLSRRIRRRFELKRNPISGFCMAGDGTRWLRTHVWCAKRFAMMKMWGFCLPLHFQGRGRGSRALLKRAQQGVVLHDASYYCAIQLDGLEDALLSILSEVLSPFPSKDQSSILLGNTYGTAILHHDEGPIAPITYMWRPCDKKSLFTCMDDNTVISDIQPIIEAHLQSRQLWIWIHASAFKEGYAAVEVVCKKQMTDTRFPISCISLDGYLGRLELMGPRAFQLLQKVLCPINSISENYLEANKNTIGDPKYEAKSKKSLVIEDGLCSCGVVSAVVRDPRLLFDKFHSDVPASMSTSCESGDIAKRIHVDHVPSAKPFEKMIILCSQSSSKMEQNEISNSSNELWDAINGINPPDEEEIILSERNASRLKYFCLSSRDSVSNLSSNHSRSCPVLLLKNYKQNDPLERWSIICPLSWVKVFWMSFITSGARAVGLVEKHWIAHEAGLPYFPDDFPDTTAYLNLMENKSIVSDNKITLRPCSVRPSRIPILPPWDAIAITLDDIIGSADTLETSNGLNSTNNLYSRSIDKFVVRQADKLARCLSEIGTASLPLFREHRQWKLSRCDMMKHDNYGPNQNEQSRLHDRKLCLARVLLRPYKKGYFEEGAVVCAPRKNDIAPWICRVEDIENQPQITQAAASSYFIEASEHRWDLQIPDDFIARESFRWPIGFITTGLVRGSKKQVAGGFCEAVLLAGLRKEQEKALSGRQEKRGPRRREIYVLVRNLRSTVYRPALATIVLEQQEQDVEFM